MQSMHLWGHFQIFLAFPGRHTLTIWLIRSDWQRSLNEDASMKICIIAFTLTVQWWLKHWSFILSTDAIFCNYILMFTKGWKNPCSEPFYVRGINGYKWTRSLYQAKCIHFLDLTTFVIFFLSSLSMLMVYKVFNVMSSFVQAISIQAFNVTWILFWAFGFDPINDPFSCL